jgi:hypothetical protein
VNSRLKSWVDRVNQTDRGLAALQRGLILIRRDDADKSLVFVWHAVFLKTTSRERQAGRRAYLGPYSEYAIQHFTLEEWGGHDPMLDEALALGARVKAID